MADAVQTEEQVAAQARQDDKQALADRTAEIARVEEEAAEGRYPYSMETDHGDRAWEDMEVMTKEEVLLQSSPQSKVDITVRTTDEDLAALGHAVDVEVEPTASQIAFAGPFSGHIVKDVLIPQANLPWAWRDPAIATPGLPTEAAIDNVARYGSVEAPAEPTDSERERQEQRSTARKQTRRGTKKSVRRTPAES